MCAPPQAIGKARARGIDIRNSCMISRIVGREGKPSGIECFEISGFRFDDQCRLAVRGAGGETILLPADTVISAVGLMPDLGFIEDRDRYRFSPKGALTIDPATFATPVTGVFAAGDAASGGPATVAQAIGGGRRAAMAIDRYLRNKPATTSETVTIDSTGELVRQASPPLPQPHVVSYEEICNVDHYEKMARHDQPPLRDPNSRPPLAETHAGLAESQAVAEAGRCMHCGHCTACGSCVESCPGLILELTAQGPRVAYPEECWHCGCCRIACPSGAVSFEFPLHMLV